MIYVNKEQLAQVEYLIEQSARGFHVLFEPETIREVFQQIDDSNIDNNDEIEDGSPSVEKHIENMILQPTLDSKRAYLENLRPKTYARVVYTYFSIVENNVFSSIKYSQ